MAVETAVRVKGEKVLKDLAVRNVQFGFDEAVERVKRKMCPLLLPFVGEAKPNVLNN